MPPEARSGPTLNKPDAADYLTFSVPTLLRRVEAGEIAAIRDGGRTYFLVSELDRYLAEKQREAVKQQRSRKAVAKPEPGQPTARPRRRATVAS
jgi:excisionase family DNA binding protein